MRKNLKLGLILASVGYGLAVFVTCAYLGNWSLFLQLMTLGFLGFIVSYGLILWAALGASEFARSLGSKKEITIRIKASKKGR